MATWSVYVYDELRKTGDFVLPVVGLPDRIHLGVIPFWVAILLSLAIGISGGYKSSLVWLAPLSMLLPALGVLAACITSGPNSPGCGSRFPSRIKMGFQYRLSMKGMNFAVPSTDSVVGGYRPQTFVPRAR